MADTKTLPSSTAHFGINLFSCAIFFVAIYWLKLSDGKLSPYEALFALFLMLCPIMLYDMAFKTSKLTIRHRFNLGRIVLKLLGLYATFALLLFVYWLLPEYGNFYKPFWSTLEVIGPWLVGLAIPYFFWLDNKLTYPEDAYYHMGLAVTGQFSKVDKRMLWEHTRAWIVKGFFLPLMSIYLMGNIQKMFNFHAFSSYFDFYNFAYHMIFTVDLLFACTGYIMTMKIFNSQIFSAEPTTLGWVACLMGYAPFWAGLFGNVYFAYDNDGVVWDDMLRGVPSIMYIWGIMILLLVTLYSLATIAFGYRFSNLTYRGLITGGPYRFTKHPAYLCKNLSWWLIAVPFFSEISWENAVRSSILLLGVNLIYYIRARTEENHLSNYPEYVAYAEWINEHGLLRKLGKLIPYLRYDYERTRRSGSHIYAPFTGRKDLVDSTGDA